jgi:hypothetical protein
MKEGRPEQKLLCYEGHEGVTVHKVAVMNILCHPRATAEIVNPALM